MQSGNQLDTTTRRTEARFAETVLCLQVKAKVGYKTEKENRKRNLSLGPDGREY